MSLVEVAFAGRTFKLEWADGTDQIAAQMTTGSYEPPLPMLMMAILTRTDGAFVDVGANTGIYSILAALMTAERPIIAFEPNPIVAATFRANLACNGFTDRVVIHGLALSDQAGRLDLYMPDQGHGLIETSASLERSFQTVASSIQVDVKRLDDMGITDLVSVIKVDIEGHEHAFLRGAEMLVDRDRPFIFAEVLQPARRNLIGKFLRDNSYVDFRLRPDMAIHDGDVLYDVAAWNHALVPVERLGKFLEACNSCGLPMLRRFTVSGP